MTDETPGPRTRVRTILVFSMFLAVLGAVALFAYFATFSRPVTTVIVVRHAEKNIEPGNPDPDLSQAGQARAQELAQMLGNAQINAIYATQFKRTQQTVKPLADRLGVPVNIIEATNTQDLVRQILTTHRGQTIFVAGHNNTAPRQGARRRKFAGDSRKRVRQHVHRNCLQIWAGKGREAEIWQHQSGGWPERDDAFQVKTKLLDSHAEPGAFRPPSAKFTRLARRAIRPVVLPPDSR